MNVLKRGGRDMKRRFWTFMLILSGMLIGTWVAGFFMRIPREVSMSSLILGLVLSLISIWGAKKYAGIELILNRK